MRKKGSKASVFVNYLFSYLGLALFSCSLIGYVLFSHFVDELKISYDNTVKQKADIIASDIQSQFEKLENITYKISSELVYQPFYLNQGNYYEKEMLTDFEKYVDNSAYAEDYFLLYQSNGNIYSVNADDSSEYRPEVYFSKVLGVGDYEPLYTQLMTLKMTQTLFVADTDYVLLCFPTKFINSISSNAVLCFVVNQADFHNRILITTGELAYNYEIYYEDVLIAADGSYIDREAGSIKQVASVSDDGRFSLRLYYWEQSFMMGFSDYQDIKIIAIIAAVLLFISLFSLYLSYARFRPIARLNAKIQQQRGINGSTKNELRNLEDMLDSVIEQNKASSLRIDQQMLELKRQIVKLLLKGEYDETMQERLEFMQIHLVDKSLSVAILKFDEAAAAKAISFAGMDRIATKIEDLSNNEIQFWGCIDKGKYEIDVIIAMYDYDILDDAKELIHSFIDAAGLHAAIGFGGIYNSLGKLPASYLEASLSMDYQNTILKAQYPEFEFPTEYDRKNISRLAWAIRHGDYDGAIKILSAFIDQENSEFGSEMMQRITYSNVLSILVNTAHELGIAISPQQISPIMTAQNPKELFECTLEWIRYLCSCMDPSAQPDEKTITLKVVDYVKNHYLENDLCLDRIADQFEVSMGYLSRLFKENTGENYKNYVIKLRIEHAKRCLEGGMSVSTTSEIVGYMNISHFIKIFKQLVGITPLVYQKKCAGLVKSD